MRTRRQFINRALWFLSGLGLVFSPIADGVRVVFAKAKKWILPKNTRMDSLVGKNPATLDTRNLELTPIQEFETMGLDDHDVDLKKWRLEINGQVQRSQVFTYDQIAKMPSIEKNVLLICPGFFAYHARWQGFSVAYLLDKAGAGPAVTHVSFSGPKGSYEKTERFPIEEILADRVFLAYRVNGNVLPKKHGFPLRVVAEGHYGAEWVKYVDKITANIS